MYCFEGLSKYRKKIEDIVESGNGKKIYEATKKIIERKKSDPHATNHEISEESGVEESTVSAYTKFLCENGIFYRMPLRKEITSGRRLSEWKYGIRKKKIEINKETIASPKIDKVNDYVV